MGVSMVMGMVKHGMGTSTASTALVGGEREESDDGSSGCWRGHICVAVDGVLGAGRRRMAYNIREGETGLCVAERRARLKLPSAAGLHMHLPSYMYTLVRYSRLTNSDRRCSATLHPTASYDVDIPYNKTKPHFVTYYDEYIIYV